MSACPHATTTILTKRTEKSDRLVTWVLGAAIPFGYGAIVPKYG
jgi:hypothetical protein